MNLVDRPICSQCNENKVEKSYKVRTLCANCHRLKTQLNRDGFKKNKVTRVVPFQ